MSAIEQAQSANFSGAIQKSQKLSKFEIANLGVVREDAVGNEIVVRRISPERFVAEKDLVAVIDAHVSRHAMG